LNSAKPDSFVNDAEFFAQPAAGAVVTVDCWLIAHVLGDGRIAEGADGVACAADALAVVRNAEAFIDVSGAHARIFFGGEYFNGACWAGFTTRQAEVACLIDGKNVWRALKFAAFWAEQSNARGFTGISAARTAYASRHKFALA
jgi:hypothetical protein